MIELEGIDHVALGVSNVERSAQWYIDVLGFEHRHKGMWEGVPMFIRKGTTALALFPRKSNSESGASHGGTGMLHLAFRATRAAFLHAQKELKDRGIRFEFTDHEISQSIYFNDPDDHKLEITTYELK